MSDYRVLYYPRFEPKLNWLLSTLLFVDGVNRIIPDDAEHKDSRQIAELRNALDPDPAVPISTDQKKDFFLEFNDHYRMKHAFEAIVYDYEEKLKKGQDARIRYDVIYQAKIPWQTERLLRDTSIGGAPLIKEVEGRPRVLAVERRAGQLILSYVANTLAKREGIDAITDFQSGFAVNALENQRIPFNQPEGFAEGCLIGAIASCQIPDEISTLSLNAYKELREQYAGIRATFKKLSISLAATSNLKTITDPTVFQKRLKTTVDDFVKECDDYEKTKARKKLKKWGYFGVGTLIGFATAPFGGLAALAGKAGQVAFQVVDKKVNQSTKDVSEVRPYQMLCGLKEDVLKRSQVKKMIHM